LIFTKRENYELCHSGGYGNRVRQWASIEDWRTSGYVDPVAMRVALPGGGGGPSKFSVERWDVEHVARQWRDELGISCDCIRLSEMADGLRILQGEYLNDICTIDSETRHGLFLHTRESGPMPLALKASKATTFGLRADLMIRLAMTPSSYSDWQELLNRYPGHVLEVSIWESCLGDCPSRNAVVWEIRRY
jgi:hypothetical protein